MPAGATANHAAGGSSEAAAGGGEDDSFEQVFEPTAEFRPVVVLPPAVEKRTGEARGL